MNAALWTAQILLAAIFLASGAAKLTMSKPAMITSGQTGVAPFPLPVIRLTAACEVLAAIGLVLPQAMNIGAPGLTIAAAAGLIVVMIGAACAHASLKEFPQVGLNIFLAALCIFVIVGRT